LKISRANLKVSHCFITIPLNIPEDREIMKGVKIIHNSVTAIALSNNHIPVSISAERMPDISTTKNLLIQP
jgi:hypothetical protein